MKQFKLDIECASESKEKILIIVDKKSLEEIELEYIIKEVKVRNTWHSWEDVKEELLV